MFDERLKQLGIKKMDLAKTLGVAPATISRWKQQPPKYVWAYLNERIKIAEAEQRVQLLIERIDEVCLEFSKN